MRTAGARSIGRRTRVRRGFVAGVVACCVILAACATPEPTPTPTPPSPLVVGIREHLDWLDTNDLVRNIRIIAGGETIVDVRVGGRAGDSRNTRGITASIVSLLIGIAIDQGRIEGVDASLGDLLPDYREVMTDEVAAITLRQVLTHTAGFAAGGGRVEELDFQTTADWVEAILVDRAQRGDNAGHMKYSSPSAHIAAAVLSEAVDGDVIGFARSTLFDALGIDADPAYMPRAAQTDAEFARVVSEYGAARFAWPTDPQGVVDGWWGLKLTADQLTRIAQLVLQEGTWEGTQVVSAGWVRESTAGVAEANGDRYGYQWSVFDGEHRVIAAMGFGGQLLAVVPDLELVTVITADYDEFGRAPSYYSTGNALRLLREVIVPEIP